MVQYGDPYHVLCHGVLCCAAGPSEEWDPAEGLAPEQLADMQRDYEEQLQRRRNSSDPPRDKWITPLLDWQVRSSSLRWCGRVL